MTAKDDGAKVERRILPHRAHDGAKLGEELLGDRDKLHMKAGGHGCQTILWVAMDTSMIRLLA